ncbi:MAG: hypothetical protein AB7P17_12970 [Nitrospirales bacterium]|nr:hypothetical protein [Nitrospirales bacterium]
MKVVFRQIFLPCGGHRVSLLGIFLFGRAHEGSFADIGLVQAAYRDRLLSLYAKLGFNAYEPISTIQGPVFHSVLPGRAVRPATKKDVTACNRLCVQVHGHDRECWMY